MAALSDAAFPEVLELRHTAAAALDRLLTEETQVWDDEFAWDFRPSADLVRRFVQMQSLVGYSLRAGQELVGYGYQVCEERKGLIGDFYVRPSRFSSSHEMLLLGAIVQGLMHTPGVRRIESQLMMMRQPSSLPIPFDRYMARHNRYFMEIDRGAITALQSRIPKFRVKFARWLDRFHEDTAHLISAAYRGHVDSEINDQYRTIPGARRFLTNIVKYPGCGQFLPGSSFAAMDDSSGRLCGVCLASMVSGRSGHITQLCVLPAIRGSGLGYELLRLALAALAEQGCSTVSLTVTCSNVDAIRLYEAVGFRIRSTFPALVWDGF